MRLRQGGSIDHDSEVWFKLKLVDPTLSKSGKPVWQETRDPSNPVQ